MRHRRARSIYEIVGFDAAWKPHLFAKTGEGLLHAPAPPPVPVQDVVVDERLATEPLTADGELLN